MKKGRVKQGRMKMDKKGRMKKINEVKRKMEKRKGRGKEKMVGGNEVEKKGRVKQARMKRDKKGRKQRRIKEVISRSRYKGLEKQALYHKVSNNSQFHCIYAPLNLILMMIAV